MKVYMSSPLFTKEEKRLVRGIANAFKKHSNPHADFYSPQDFTIKGAWDYPNHEWADKIRAHDIEELDAADTVIGILYGDDKADNGTAYEIGYAAARKKNIILVLVNPNLHEFSLMFKDSWTTIYAYDSENEIIYEYSANFVKWH